MTIQNNPTLVHEYLGDGLNTIFPYLNRIVKSTDIRVLGHLTDRASSKELTQGVDYIVTGVGNEAGGSVVMTLPPAVGYILLISYYYTFGQELSFPNEGRVFTNEIEQVADNNARATMGVASQLEVYGHYGDIADATHEASEAVKEYATRARADAESADSDAAQTAEDRISCAEDRSSATASASSAATDATRAENAAAAGGSQLDDLSDATGKPTRVVGSDGSTYSSYSSGSLAPTGAQTRAAFVSGIPTAHGDKAVVVKRSDSGTYSLGLDDYTARQSAIEILDALPNANTWTGSSLIFVRDDNLYELVHEAGLRGGGQLGPAGTLRDEVYAYGKVFRSSDIGSRLTVTLNASELRIYGASHFTHATFTLSGLGSLRIVNNEGVQTLYGLFDHTANYASYVLGSRHNYTIDDSIWSRVSPVSKSLGLVRSLGDSFPTTAFADTKLLHALTDGSSHTNDITPGLYSSRLIPEASMTVQESSRFRVYNFDAVFSDLNRSNDFDRTIGASLTYSPRVTPKVLRLSVPGGSLASEIVEGTELNVSFNFGSSPDLYNVTMKQFGAVVDFAFELDLAADSDAGIVAQINLLAFLDNRRDTDCTLRITRTAETDDSVFKLWRYQKTIPDFPSASTGGGEAPDLSGYLKVGESPGIQHTSNVPVLGTETIDNPSQYILQTGTYLSDNKILGNAAHITFDKTIETPNINFGGTMGYVKVRAVLPSQDRGINITLDRARPDGSGSLSSQTYTCSFYINSPSMESPRSYTTPDRPTLQTRFVEARLATFSTITFHLKNTSQPEFDLERPWHDWLNAVTYITIDSQGASANRPVEIVPFAPQPFLHGLARQTNTLNLTPNLQVGIGESTYRFHAPIPLETTHDNYVYRLWQGDRLVHKLEITKTVIRQCGRTGGPLLFTSSQRRSAYEGTYCLYLDNRLRTTYVSELLMRSLYGINRTDYKGINFSLISDTGDSSAEYWTGFTLWSDVLSLPFGGWNPHTLEVWKR